MNERHLDSETHYRLLRRIEQQPNITQRQLAKEFGLSLGKVNYCLKALLTKGYIKAGNFKNSGNKRAYLYQLTPAGIAAKSQATLHFLKRKQLEYKQLIIEIEELKAETERKHTKHSSNTSKDIGKNR